MDEDELPKQHIEFRPLINERIAPALCERLYGLTVDKIDPILSYDDKNFHVQVHCETTNQNISQVSADGYVLKILNSLSSKEEALIDAQNQVMIHLTSKGFRTTTPVKNLSGILKSMETYESMGAIEWLKNNDIKTGSDQTFAVRLLTYIPGEMLCDIEVKVDLLYKLGKYTAEIDLALKDFDCTAFLNKAKTVWNVENFAAIKPYIFSLKNGEYEQLVSDVMSAYDTDVKPFLPLLERGLIHGDMNPQNILVRKSEMDNQGYGVHGILDYGDMIESFYVNELAITCMYAMLVTNMVDPLVGVGYIIAGYEQVRKLDELEWKMLKVLISARFCQSLVLGHYSHLHDTSNDYLLVTAKNGFRCLRMIWNTPDSVLIENWKRTVGNCQSDKLFINTTV